MCEPLTIAAGAAVLTSAVSAGLSIQGQTMKRSAEVEYQNRQVEANRAQMRENRDLATKAYLDQALAIQANLAETREATAAQNYDTSVKRQQAEGSTIAAAAEGGVEGLSLHALLADFHKQEDMFLTRNEQNLIFKQQQSSRETRGLQNQATSRIAQIKPIVPGPIAPVDYFSPLLGIANNATQTYLGVNAATKPIK